MGIIKVYFELLNLVPMPYQVAVFVFITICFFYLVLRLLKFLFMLIGKVSMKLTMWGTQLLLLPEYLFTSLLRIAKINHVPGAGVYDDIVETVGGGLYRFLERMTKIETINFRFPTGWVFLLMIIIIASWYLATMPKMNNTLTKEYISNLFHMYVLMQRWALGYSE